MKNKISILACMLLLVQVANSQMKSYEGYVGYYDHTEHDGTVVRHWKDNFNVVYLYDSINSKWLVGFHYVDNFTSGVYTKERVRCYDIPTSLVIKDLFVVGNMSYLCGTYKGKGVYGWFINDTLPTTLSYYLFPVNQVDTLRKLVVCRDINPDLFHLIAIGVHNTTNYNCILEVPNITATPATYKLSFVNTAGGVHNEVLDDVVLTDDYVVFVSRDKREGVGELTFRYSSPVNVLGSSLINTHYNIPTSNSEASYPVAATRMDGNSFAVGYTAGDAAETRVHRLTVGSGITLLHSQHTSLCGTARMMDMAYHSTTGKITLLWPDIAGYSHFFTFSPYVSGGQVATHIYPPRTRCYSIDDMDGEAFVAFGGDGITLQRTYTALDFRAMVGCMGSYLAGISTYSAPPITSFTDPLQVLTFITTSDSPGKTMFSDKKFKYCSSN